MNNFECNYCKNNFKSKTSFVAHQKYAKYCINLRGEILENDFKCNGCNKSFTKIFSLERHIEICKSNGELIKEKEKNKILEENILKYKLLIENKDKEIKKKDKQINKLQEQLTSIAKAAVSKPSNTTTNNINNQIINLAPLDLSKKRIKHILDTKYTEDYIFDGQKGLAKFTFDHILKDEEKKLLYICTDSGRYFFKFKNFKGDITKDIKAKELTNRLIKGGVKQKNNKLASEYWTQEDGNIDQKKFVSLLPKASEISTLSISNNTMFANELSAITTNNISEETDDEDDEDDEVYFLSDEDFLIEH